MGFNVKLPTPFIKGKGSFTLPPLTIFEMEEIKKRADQERAEIKTDVYRLLHEVARLKERS